MGACLVSLLMLPSAAHAAYAWQDGGIQESQITNCVSIIQGSPYTEAGAGTYVGAYVNPSALRHIGDLYYVHVVVYGLGNSCSGQYADIQLGLPAGTAPAISGTYPVKCFLIHPPDSTHANSYSVQDTGSACPQTTSNGTHGYVFDPPNGSISPPFWPLPQGGGVELQIPVMSTKAVDSATALSGYVTLADGNGDPTLTPTALLDIGDLTPVVAYPTSNAVSSQSTTSVVVQAAIYNYYRSGYIKTEFGSTTAYGHTQGSAATDAVPAADYAIQDYSGWSGLQAGCTYDWRIDFVPDSGSEVFGSNQIAKTLGSGGNCANTTFSAFTPTAPTITFPMPNAGNPPQTGTTAPPTPPAGSTGSTGQTGNTGSGGTTSGGGATLISSPAPPSPAPGTTGVAASQTSSFKVGTLSVVAPLIVAPGTLTLTLNGGPGLVTLTLLHGTRTTASTHATYTSHGRHTLKLKLPHGIKAGTYRLRIAFRPRGSHTTKTRTITITVDLAL